MNSIVSQMLERYDCRTREDYLNALKEIAQEIALCALAETDFFSHAAFYGGTALRIFYGLERYSEDLDFSLMKKEDFRLESYFSALEQTFASLGMSFKVFSKVKNAESTIQSAFLKGGTLEHMLLIGAPSEISRHIQHNESLKIKFEIDIDPPAFADFEFKHRLLPFPYRVRLYDKGSLFAGKLHAVLARDWKNRIKGRDLFDYLFYVASETRPNLLHLRERLVASGKWHADKPLAMEDLRCLLLQRFNELDFSKAKEDVLSFVGNPASLDLWSREFFVSVTDDFFARMESKGMHE